MPSKADLLNQIQQQADARDHKGLLRTILYKIKQMEIISAFFNIKTMFNNLTFIKNIEQVRFKYFKFNKFDLIKI